MTRPALLHGCWTDANRTALQDLLARDYGRSPIAVFDWDNTCIRGDIGDAVFHQLAADLAFRFDAPGFWNWVSEASPVDSIGPAYDEFRRSPGPETRLALRFAFEAVRQSLYAGMDDNSACAWDAGAFLGWSEADARDFAARVIRAELDHPLSLDVFESEGRVMEIPRGIRVRPEMQELVSGLQTAGWQVWVISASAQWVVEPFAALYGIPPSRVVGMRRALAAACSRAAIDPPVSFSDGKLDAYQMFVSRQRPPDLAAGDSVYDWKLIEWAEEARLLVEPTHGRLREFAKWETSIGRAWLIQAFE